MQGKYSTVDYSRCVPRKKRQVKVWRKRAENTARIKVETGRAVTRSDADDQAALREYLARRGAKWC